MKSQKEGTQKTMRLILQIYSIDIVLKDLGFFLKEEVINTKAARSVHVVMNGLIKDLALLTDDILDCLNVPVHALYTPIIGDYVGFNQKPNYGEVIGAKL